MASINLYKIDQDKLQLFLQEVSSKLDLIDTVTIERDENESYGLTLYLSNPQDERDISWQWILDGFNCAHIEIKSAPKAILLVESNEEQYAVTFGSSFFIVDKYCDYDFGFNFARKFKFKAIKTTALTSPSSKRNKTVNTYIDYNELEFDSGESFAKIKGKADIPDGFTKFKPAIEIGTSIRFAIENENLNSIIDLIEFVESTMSSDIENYKIPVFSKITDPSLLGELDAELIQNVKQNPAQINISELDIIGVTEVFNNNDSEFVLRYGRHEKVVPELSNDAINSFCGDNGLNMFEILLDIKVVSQKDGVCVRTDCIKDLIDYTNDQQKCVLSKGKWYKYNCDYLQYLADSISEIKAIYNPAYDFDRMIYNRFIDQKLIQERGFPEYLGKTEDEIKAKLTKKYYAERVFNLIREQDDGFINQDREYTRFGNISVEIMDLYKDDTMYAVKIGSSSAKLCYAVDQSLSSLKLHKKGALEGALNITKVALWFVLERSTHLRTCLDGSPDLTDLNMLMLQNRIDQWKKEVRLSGFEPVIYINYRAN